MALYLNCNIELWIFLTSFVDIPIAIVDTILYLDFESMLI